jgi:transposase
MQVSVGVDSHKSSFSSGAVDALGRALGVREFSNDRKGFVAACSWVTSLGTTRIGIEGAGRYGRALAKFLLAAGHDVVEVPATLTAHERRRQRNQGKSDPVDAYAIARVVARGEGLADPRRDSLCDDLKLLADRRDHLVHNRTELANQSHQDLGVIHPGYERRICNLTSKKNLSAALMLVRGDRSVRADMVRARVADIRRLDAQIADLDRRIAATLAETGSTLTEMPGVGPLVAARILGEIGDPARVRSRAAFGVLTGTAPLEASSGTTTRHRVNRGGNRQLNRALYVIAFTQARSHPEAQAYLERKRAEGKTYREALRCLKRSLANVIYRRLMADLEVARSAA